MRGDLQRQETLVVQRDGAIASLRDEACTRWASGWLAFQRKAVSAYPGLDLNFNIPSDEEAEDSFFTDYSGEPNTPAEARSPSLPSAPSSDVRTPSYSFAFFFFFFFFFTSGFEPGIYVMSFSMNTPFSISLLLPLSFFFSFFLFHNYAPCVALPELS